MTFRRSRYANGGRPFKLRAKRATPSAPPSPRKRTPPSDPLKALKQIERIGKRYQRCRRRGNTHEVCLSK